MEIKIFLSLCVCIQTEMYYLLEDIEESRRFYSQIVGCKFCLVFNWLLFIHSGFFSIFSRSEFCISEFFFLVRANDTHMKTEKNGMEWNVNILIRLNHKRTYERSSSSSSSCIHMSLSCQLCFISLLLCNLCIIHECWQPARWITTT